MKFYADSSFVVPLYVPESHSAAAMAELEVICGGEDSVVISPLTRLEMINAVLLQSFRKQMSSETAAHAVDVMNFDVANRVLNMSPVPPGAWDTASRISREHTEATGCRSLDVLHVAIALEFLADGFLTFDNRQKELARRAGLAVH